ncbi:MAG: 2-hydroxyacyl-CoA dehydratase family protein [Thermodesulfobacteriota bacterium]
MNGPQLKLAGFACAYTPLALLDAAGMTPFRVLPVGGDWPDQAGTLLHDNICPHVKRVLNRAMAGDVPELSVMVFMNSCDAMRRLYDAWRAIRPQDRTFFVELPPTADENAVPYFVNALKRLAGELAEAGGDPIDQARLLNSLVAWKTIANLQDELRARVRRGSFPGGPARLQEIYNQCASRPFSDTLAALDALVRAPEEAAGNKGLVPVLLFGNVLPDPEAIALFEQCGAKIADEDLCTGSRLFAAGDPGTDPDPFRQLASMILGKPPCARTFDSSAPLSFARNVLSRARQAEAAGVIAHVVKFCDPYLARLPAVRETLRQQQIPFLLLEGDCTLGSLGQARTRIEAFMEMLR